MLRTLILITAAALSACETPREEVTFNDVKREAKETVDTATALAAQERAAYQATLTQKVQALGEEITALKSEAARKKGKAKAELDRKIDALEVKKKDLEGQLAGLQEKTGDAWDSAKAGVDRAFGELQEAYSDAKAKLK